MKEMTRQAKDRHATNVLNAINAIGKKYKGQEGDIAANIAALQEVGDVIGKLCDSSFKSGFNEGFEKGKRERFTFTKN